LLSLTVPAHAKSKACFCEADPLSQFGSTNLIFIVEHKKLLLKQAHFDFFD
jgi:hypothetical protein